MSLPNKTNLLPDRPGIPPMAAMPEPEMIDIPALAKAYADGNIDLICVLGPTASGKTRYAVQLARAIGNAEILSADSRQVYTGMDIGTGKDLGEYGEVPYHLIDIVPAGSKYNIYEYQAAFADAWADVRARGCVPILCGGSGLYIESATRAYKFDRENGVPAERLPQKTFYIGTLVSREERVARIDRRLDASPASTAAWTSASRTALSRKSRASWTAASRPTTSSGTALNTSSSRSTCWGNSPTTRCTSSSPTPSTSSPSAR